MKNEEKDLWLKALKEQLEDHSEPIPIGGWERLEQSLNTPTPKKIIPWKRWAYVGAAASIVLLLGFGSLFMMDSLNESIIDDYAHQFPSDPEPDSLPSLSSPSESIPVISSVVDEKSLAQAVNGEAVKEKRDGIQNQSQLISDRSTKGASLDLSTDSTDDVVNVMNDPSLAIGAVKDPWIEEDFTEELETNKLEESSEQISETSSSSDASEKKERKTTRSSSDKLQIPSSSTKEVHTNKRWGMGVAAGSAGLMAKNSSTGSSNMMQQMSTILSEEQMRQLNNGAIALPSKDNLVVVNGVPYRLTADEVVEYNHKQPISVGFSFRKYFNDKLSLSTGLMYTYLSSDMKVLSDKSKIAQKFHYLGIPVKLNYDFASYKSFRFYASAGGSIERAIYGKQGNKKVTNNKFQFAVTGGLGAQVNITRNVGFYVEPGVAYYFDDGSAFETIRSDRPFNFDINAGLRLTY